jgi:hypothetical protein
MRLAVVVVTCWLLAAGEAAAQGAGTGEGGGGGRQRAVSKPAACGNDLTVVFVDGSKRQYGSIAEFFKDYPQRMIDQGEQQRAAIAVSSVLKAHGGDWLEALGCDNKSTQLPSGLPFEGADYLVLTGKQGLKAVREVGSGSYSNTQQQIRKLTLHKVSGPAKK